MSISRSSPTSHISGRTSEALTAYLQERAGEPRQWGRADCGTLIAGWVEIATGRYRCPAYANKEQALAVLDCWGRLARVVGRYAREIGLPLTLEPQAGDIGVIMLDRHMAGAIKTAHGWAYKSKTGMGMMADGTVRVAAAWRVPNG